MKATVSELNNKWWATVETKNGHRYHTTYSHPVTEKEVIEDFQEDRSTFTHTN